jgi:phosphate transport system substrate-binding protein
MKKHLAISRLVILTAVVATLVLGVGCQKEDELMGTITEAGSTTVQPVAEKLALEFMNLHPNVNILISGGGSGEGVKQAAAGSVDLGAASRRLKADEPQLVTHLLGFDGIAVIVHASNPIKGLTMEEVAKIFSGEITDWSQVGAPAGKITIISRELNSDSGTLVTFQEMVMKTSKITGTAVFEPSNQDIKAKVSTTPAAIGYLSVGLLGSGIKALDINGIACTLETCKTNTYPVVRPLYFLTKAQPEGIVKSFIDFCTSKDGQKIVADEGYISNN